MYQRILVPTDGSELSQKAVQTAVQLAQRFGAELFALTVTEPYPYSPLAEAQPVLPQEFLDAEMRLANARLKAVSDAAGAAGVRCEGASVEGAQPWRAICDEAGNRSADLIVMASHGRSGLAGLLLGSETQKVLTHCAVPVLVVR
ncbi:MAG: universal stress protein [Burkholderiales bacterium]|uniref:universal stress protein n=1 Tax=Inhella sp. TaxID=1921806 RepID=UPI001AC6A31A|nr:universal stress protein [Burkholderiales bacterium]